MMLFLGILRGEGKEDLKENVGKEKKDFLLLIQNADGEIFNEFCEYFDESLSRRMFPRKGNFNDSSKNLFYRHTSSSTLKCIFHPKWLERAEQQ